MRTPMRFLINYRLAAISATALALAAGCDADEGKSGLGPFAPEVSTSGSGDTNSGTGDSTGGTATSAPGDSGPNTTSPTEPPSTTVASSTGHGDETTSDSSSGEAEDDGGVRIIWDTDMASDWDDAGALAILHALADNGEARILGVGSSTRGSAGEWNPHTMDIINTYYGRPDIPIGRSVSGPNVSDTYGEWATQRGYTYDLAEDQVWDDTVSLYRKLLSEQPDHSVVIVTTGYMSNIADLLQSSPDRFSDLTGVELVEQKVDFWSTMAGRYPGSGSEANLQDWDGQAKYAFENFPRPILGTSAETGNASIAGNTLEATPESNPIRAIYRKRLDDNGYPNSWSHNTWDLVATLVAVRPAVDYFDVTSSGTNTITIQSDNSQHNEWHSRPDNGFRYLVPTEITDTLELLISQPPAE